MSGSVSGIEYGCGVSGQQEAADLPAVVLP